MKATDKLDFIKMKNFCSAKDNVKRMRRKSHRLGEIFAKDTSDKDWYPKYTKGTSLVVQWLRIRLPMQGTRV